MPANPLKMPPEKAETPVRWKLRLGRLLIFVRVGPKGSRLWRIKTADGFYMTAPLAFLRIQRVDGPDALRPVFYGLFFGPFNVKAAILPKVAPPAPPAPQSPPAP